MSKLQKIVLSCVLITVVTLLALGLRDPVDIEESSKRSVSSPGNEGQSTSIEDESEQLQSAKTIIENLPDVEEARLYSKNLPLVLIYDELREAAESGDPRAAIHLVGVEQQCLMSRSDPDYANFMFNAVGEEIANDKDGRLFFNQTVAFSTAGIRDFDGLLNFVQSGKDFCEGFEAEIDNRQWIDFLRVAADAGIVDAQVALWSHSLPEHLAALAEHLKNPNELRHLRTSELEEEWTHKKIEYLKSAANSGDYRALVLLGDIYSTDRWVQPDLISAYGYYGVAADIDSWPFLESKLAALEVAMNSN